MNNISVLIIFLVCMFFLWSGIVCCVRKMEIYSDAYDDLKTCVEGSYKIVDKNEIKKIKKIKNKSIFLNYGFGYF